jgi:hypothetical protein
MNHSSVPKPFASGTRDRAAIRHWGMNHLQSGLWLTFWNAPDLDRLLPDPRDRTFNNVLHYLPRSLRGFTDSWAPGLSLICKPFRDYDAFS